MSEQQGAREFEPAMMFQDHMVLQQGKRLPVWGTGPDGAEVSVAFLGRTYRTTVVDGTWKVVMDEAGVCRGERMVIRCGEEAREVRDVAVGEVWVAGGQSNMEFFLRYDADLQEELKREPCDDIRFFDYPEVSYTGQLEVNDYSNFGFWRTCDPRNLEYFSAVAYYFARKLHERSGAPVGILGCNWGGTTASTWMDPSYLEGTPGEVWLSDYEEGLRSLDLEKYERQTASPSWSYTGKPFENAVNEKLFYGFTKRQMQFVCKCGFIYRFMARFWPANGPKSPYRPGGLYECMVRQVAPYAVAGVLWYQGESDDVHAEVYDTVLAQLIRCWRDTWQEELPFLVVQIAPLGFFFNGEPWKYPLLRRQQEKVAGREKRVWLTTSGDVGLEWDVHPKRKRPIGERLALLAAGHVYGDEVLCDPPQMVRMEVLDGGIRLAFANVAGGIVCTDPTVPELAVMREGQQLGGSKIRFEGDQLILSNGQVHAGDALEVRYAQEPYYESSIFNQAHIPALPAELRTGA